METNRCFGIWAAFLVGMLVSSLLTEALPAAEIWDATTLDLQGECVSLWGVWEYVPWERLDKIPDFKDARPVQVPRAQMPGAYRTKFPIKPAQEPQRTILQFDAVAFRCSVFVNGKAVGEHAGGMTPFALDVTGEVQTGNNELVVLVLGAKGRALSAEAAESAKIIFNDRSQAVTSGGDKTVLGGGGFPGDGIRQGVFLREVPLLRITDATFITSFRRKEMSAKTEIENQTLCDAPVVLQMDIFPYDIPTKAIGKVPLWTKSERILAKRGTNVAEIVQSWTDPKLWMPGDPHLYVARLRVSNDVGRALNERNVRFGFREVWLDGPQIVVNGKPFRAFVHGTMDTEASPATTRAMFKQVMATGINMVRAHTRPPEPSFTQIADEMGIGIIGESELCFNSNYAYDEPVFWLNFERLFRERIDRDKNHPSILIWSLANEVIICSPGAEIGQHFYEAFLHLRQVDPTRPFMQEGDGDLRDMRPDAKGYPIDIISLHPYDISTRKNPLWASEFPPVAWALEDVKRPQDIPATNKFGKEMPDRHRPWFMGEFGLAQLTYPDLYSFWTGPEAYRDLFGDAHELVRAVGEVATIQLQAFRDMNMAGMDPWDMPDKTVLGPYLKRGFEPVTTFTRDMRAHWTSGEIADRHLVTLNDSFEKKNLKLTVALKQGEKEIVRKVEFFTLEPGSRKDIAWQQAMPRVATKTALSFVVSLADNQDKAISHFAQQWMVYPEIPPVQEWRDGQVWLCGAQETLGAITEWSGSRLQPESDLRRAVQAHPAVILLDSTTETSLDQKTHEILDRYVEGGGVLMVSGADKAFAGGEMLEANPDSDSTRLFLLRQSPLTDGTTAQDWEFWHPDHLVSRGNYTMSFDPLFEFPLVGGGRNGPMNVPVAILKKGAGVSMASRLQLNQAIAREPVARIFLNNLVLYAKSLGRARSPRESTLVIFCPPEEREAWKARMQKARIPFSFDEGTSLEPGQQIVFLSGRSALSEVQLGQLTRFVNEGGTLWVHRLTPETSYLEHVSRWLDQSVILRPPAMWLQQMEVVRLSSPSPLLNGINDFITCWATFGWTNGNMSSVRTTPMADYLLTNMGEKALLKEPDWIGKWNFGPGTYMLGQAILREVGQHTRNDQPGAGLAARPVGKGRLVIDQIKWDDAMLDASSESADKARYLVGTLWKNMRELPQAVDKPGFFRKDASSGSEFRLFR
ncbi:hypothetical protein BH09VER1_BH09VER1_46520 [soil metagenome]